MKITLDLPETTSCVGVYVNHFKKDGTLCTSAVLIETEKFDGAKLIEGGPFVFHEKEAEQ